MSTWTSEELEKIGEAEELKIMPLQNDGTHQKPVIIWVVRVGEGLYIRSYKGRGSGWFQGVQMRHEGRIRAGGVEKEVTFMEESDPGLQEQIDTAYRAKYRRYEASIVDSIVSAQARSATIRLVVHEA